MISAAPVVHNTTLNGNVSIIRRSIIRGFDNPISSIRVSRVRVTLTVTVRVSRVSVMVSVRDSVK